ncbi:alpha/beta hydrolase [Streptomyces buecherae]|uniref:alpha/beta hydrolase n=1 Tax=Streptomyces buecherae TaxID=2763006 RepID=UPI0037945C10
MAERREGSGDFSGIDPERFVETVGALAGDADKLRLRSQHYKAEFRRYGIDTEALTALLGIASWAEKELGPMRRRLQLARAIDKGPDAGLKGHRVNINEAEVGKGHPRADRIPEDSEDPQANADWWDTLPPRLQKKFAAQSPERIGALDGIPSDVRDRANRTVLRQKIKDAQVEYDKLDKKLGRTGPLDLTFRRDELARRKQLKSQLKGMKTLQERLSEGGKNGVPPTFLLGFDDEKTGHAIVAFGNPDTADNVSTYVPGTNTKLESIGKDLDRAERMQGNAARLGRPQSASSIMWFDYNAPQTSDLTVPVAQQDRAKEAIPALDGFFNGLEATHQGKPSNSTVLGHSYGSLVAGKYLSHDKDTPVDNVIFVGSPGVGVDHAKDLNVDPDRVWAGKARYDKITWLPSPNPFKWGEKPFGPDPTSPAFGGGRFDVEEGSKWHPISAHSIYWDEGSTSLRNITEISLGREPIYEEPDGPTPSPSPNPSPTPPGAEPDPSPRPKPNPSPSPSPSETPGPTPAPSP